jgi:hypothetical protein
MVLALPACVTSPTNAACGAAGAGPSTGAKQVERGGGWRLTVDG